MYDSTLLDGNMLSCHRLLRLTSVSWAQVFPNQLTGATPCPGCVVPVGELSDASTGTGAIQGACAQFRSRESGY